MGRFLFAMVVGAAVYLLLDERQREWTLEQAKHASDVAVILLLRATSSFGAELTPDGWEEQRMWREQRLRELRTPRRSVNA